jgi:endonuclease YncB( thermonuclease family)
LRSQALSLPGLLGLLLALLLAWPGAALAAEVYQVRSGRLLQVGDGNRSYPVRLSCVAVDPDREEEAITWLRQALPRHTRVNLRPMGESDGTLLARVSRLPGGIDIATGLIDAGLASAEACP